MPLQGSSGSPQGVGSGSPTVSELSVSTASDGDGSDDEGTKSEESKVPRDGRSNGRQEAPAGFAPSTSMPRQAPPYKPVPSTSASNGTASYHRAPLKITAGQQLHVKSMSRDLDAVQERLQAELQGYIRTPVSSGTPSSGGGGNLGGSGSGMLRRNSSTAQMGSRRPDSAGVGGDVEMRGVRVAGAAAEGVEEQEGGRAYAYTDTPDTFDVQDANNKITPQKSPVRVTRRFNYYTQSIVLLFISSSTILFVIKMLALSLDDNFWGRMANVGFLPAVIVFMLFSVHFGLTQLVCALGPIAHMQTNSQFFSALAPARATTYPDVTVEMPVYKEGLKNVILPSIISLEAAIGHYKKAGGRAKIFVNDDGLQLISEKERAERIAFYREHGIAYVARPPHSVKVRKGLFKKASNMNYCLSVSNSTTTLMEEQGITDPELALSMVHEAAGGEFLAGGDLSMGSIILLVDCDTRVPEDCLTKVVAEFQECPELGFIQCRTTPLREGNNHWEDMIAHFTENIYDIGIALSVSSGDPAPLVGHNAFLRWEAMKAIAWQEGGMTKFWSESHVSEDFDMSLRLQTQGYIGRYATYTGAGFQEGVSLTCADEVIRLRKYAYGACEMLLNKFKHWPCRGPITKLFWSYLRARCIPWPSKLQMLGYLGTYLAMAYSIVGICVYVALRMFYGVLQEDVTNTYDVFITVVFIFGVIGIFGAGTIRYRLGFDGNMGFFMAYWIEIKAAPAMTMFWSHILWHITTACWCYFWDLPIVWGATVKETTTATFSKELRDTLVRYRGMYITLTLLYGIFAFAMVWTGQDWYDQRISFPLTFYVATHFLGPFLLNPVLTRGYY